MTDATIAKCEKVQRLIAKGKMTKKDAMKKANVSNFSFYEWQSANGRAKGKKRSVRRKVSTPLVAALDEQVAVLKEETATLWDIIRALT